jgi:condensin complex subunit 2
VSKSIPPESTPSPPKQGNSSADYPILVLPPKLHQRSLIQESKRANESEEGDEEGGDTEEQREKKARKRAQRAEATLVKDFNAIQLKKFDLEFSVDPLFKKTSADFDEGGAKGLLLNHLSLDGEGRIVFDAGDTVLEEDEHEPAEISQEGDLDLDLGDLQST